MSTISIILLLVGLVVFFVLWQKGYLLQFSSFVRSTQDELKKCAWPTKNELIASTVVVFVSLLVLGVFTGIVDLVVTALVRSLSNI